MRLRYHYQDTGPQERHDTQAQLALEMPLRCAGTAAATVCTPAGPAIARGQARLRGSSPHPGGAAGRVDTYDKQLAWPQLAGAGTASASAEPPTPSFVGAGFGTKVTAAGVLHGTTQTDVADAGEVPGGLARPRDGRGPYAVPDPIADTDRLNLELYFDPAPGAPADPNGELAQVPRRTREALAVTGGEAALAFKGHFFGAETRYTSDGDFSICYRRTLLLAPAALQVEYCGWLTRGGRSWAPEDLPAVDSP